MGVARADGPELDTDEAFQRRSWRVQRVGWAVMVVVVLAALAGLLGSGPISTATAVVPGTLRVEHQRFSRFKTPETLTVHLDSAATGTDRVLVGIDRRYLDDSRIDAITPPPARVHAAGDQLVYEFAVARPGAPIIIAFLLQPERLGLVRGRVVLHAPDGARPATFWAFVYP
ncbi:MAG TPA: hypothetical protein VNN07_00620 [Candidatus Tectomicrobia bacterium]|nr:hypothetical protein [Candidatus Tectomicrobia bacterium]